MVGVLLASAPGGEIRTLKAFSGQMNYHWSVEGWAPPLCSLRHDAPGAAGHLYRLAFRRIAQLSEEARGAADEAARVRARRAQRAVSNALLQRLRAASMLPNFRGEEVCVEDASLLGKATVGGTGDCAAPKLLAAAARRGLKPLALSEMWFGSPPPGGGRVEGETYAACESRCQSILGFMLCGADEMVVT